MMQTIRLAYALGTKQAKEVEFLAGIVGIERDGEQDQIEQMLEQIAHRGESGSKIIQSNGTTLGAV